VAGVLASPAFEALVVQPNAAIIAGCARATRTCP